MTAEYLRDILALLRGANDGTVIEVSPLRLVESIRESVSHVRAFRHPLGFIHVDLTGLIDLEHGERFRFHIWPQVHYAGDAAGNVHDHTWNLTSLVVYGELRDRNFRPAASPDGDFTATRVQYGKVNYFEPAGRYDLRLVNDRVVGAGNVYTIAARLVHETSVLQAPSITLVRSKEDEQDAGPLIFSNDGQVPRGTGVRQQLSHSELLHVLGNLLQIWSS